MQRPSVNRQFRFLKREWGYLFLHITSLAIYVVTIIMIWKLAPTVTDYDYLIAYAAAVVFGLIYALLKIIIASIVAS